jgi:uncharacterized damage-inducible protein DinB
MYRDPMDTIPAPVRLEPIDFGPERTSLEGYLDYYRATLLLKCAGLSLEQLQRRSVAPSTLSLLGLLRHMTLVEQGWFDVRFAGNDVARHYADPADPDADFNDLDGSSLEEVHRLFLATCERSRRLCEGHDLDERVARIERGADVDLRCIMVHLIEEYARHCGHADLLRECIDGATGD